MNYKDRYRRRLGRIGQDVGQAITNNTIDFINKTFHSSSTYRIMTIETNHKDYEEIESIDARVVQVERMGSLREIVLRPNESLEVGMYVEVDSEWFLLIDKYGGTGSTSIKMLAIKINESIRWRDKEQYLDFLENKKIDEDYVGEYHEFKCVTSATDLGSKSKQSKNEIEWNKHDVRLPVGQMFVSVEKNDITETIDLNDRFIFGRNSYEVIGIDDITFVDDDGYGIIQLTIKITTKSSEDDFINNIAKPIYKVNLEIDNEDDNDGRLW